MSFAEAFHERNPDAYERLLLDVIRGNQTLFMRRDEVEAAWRWIDPIREAWERSGDAAEALHGRQLGPVRRDRADRARRPHLARGACRGLVALPPHDLPPMRLRAILMIAAGVTLFGIMDGLGKFLAGDYSVVQIVWARYAFAVPVILAMARPATSPGLLNAEHPVAAGGARAVCRLRACVGGGSLG